MSNKNVQQRQLAEYLEKANRDASKLDQLWAGLDDDIEFVEKEYSSRYEVPCPEPIDKSKYNPYGYVDIVTFITHPHFLSLNPYPWQTLALKLFYRNTEGNTDIDVNCADKNEEKDCSKCVWKYVVDNELDNCLILEDGIEFLRDDFKNMKINNNVHILFVNEEMNQFDLNKNFIGYGLQGYVVTKKGATILMNKCHTMFIPIDLQIRHLCNTKELVGTTITKPYLKRQNNRVSSIDNSVTNMDNLNEKQDPNNILTRLLLKLKEKNINLDDFV